VKELRARHQPIPALPDSRNCARPQAKIALFTNVPVEAVITAMDAPSIYEIPVTLPKSLINNFKKARLPASLLISATVKSWSTRLIIPRRVAIAFLAKYTNFMIPI
jgi:CTP synthase